MLIIHIIDVFSRDFLSSCEGRVGKRCARRFVREILNLGSKFGERGLKIGRVVEKFCGKSLAGDLNECQYGLLY